MVRLLTKDEKRRVRRALEDEAPYTELRTREEFHQFALNWNWDGGFEPLEWITRQPQCDQGTALLIYWRAGPGWFCQYANRDEVIARQKNVALYDFTRDIATRLQSGFFKQQTIRFDPRNDDGADQTKSYSEHELRQTIPEIMKKPSPGESAIREELYSIVVRALFPEELDDTRNHISEGLARLQEALQELNEHSAAQEIAEGIKRLIDAYRDTHHNVSHIDEEDPILSLGWLWADQLCRAYQWEWQCRDWEDGNAIGVYSPQRRWATFPPHIVRYLIQDNREENALLALFDELEDADTKQPSVFKVAITVGWVTYNHQAGSA